MKNSRRIIFAALFLALVAIFTSCKPTAATSPSKNSEKKKVAFISNGVSPFWTIADAGVKAASEKFGIDAETFMPAQGPSDQKRIVEDLLTRGVDGIAISTIDSANQIDLINAAAKRTKLITHDSDAPGSERLLYIGVDNYKAGRECGALVREALPNGGSVMFFVGSIEADNAKRRRQGCIDAILGRPENPDHFDPPSEVIDAAGFKILGTLTDQFDQARGKANAEDVLSKFPDIGCMIGLYSYNAPLILQALERAGKLGQVKVVSFDEDNATLAGIESGSVVGTVVQNPYMYGFKSVEILSELIKGNDSVIPTGKFIDIPARKIRKDNVAEFWADLKAKTGAK